MQPSLSSVAARLQIDAASSRGLRLAFAHACALRVQHLLESAEVLACLAGLGRYLAGGMLQDDFDRLAVEAGRLANQHPGSKSIDGCGHAAVSATYAVANALAGKALQAADYAAYAAVYGQGGYGAVADRESFAPEVAWQIECLTRLAMRPLIRDEGPDDEAAIDRVTRDAFTDHPHRQQTEHHIVRALRQAGALTVSFVAERGEASGAASMRQIVGHVAFSPVRVAGQHGGWYGLGPLSVAPDSQRQGVGSLLVNAGLARLRAHHAAGCVVLGDPAYYARFGFTPAQGLVLPGVPPMYFQQLTLADLPSPEGEVAYHPAFEAGA